MTTPLTRYAEAEIPTEYGTMTVVVFRENADAAREHMAIVHGDVARGEDVLARVHSECWTGEALHSLKCDCREQLDQALKAIVDEGTGVVLYLRQEGRGIGLGNKIRAYALQSMGADTVDANRLLGFDDDLRTYGAAARMLEALDVRSIALMTNNPAKVAALVADGVNVGRRVPMKVTSNPFNAEYLITKRERMGHAAFIPEIVPEIAPVKVPEK